MKRSLMLSAIFIVAVGCTPNSIKPIRINPNDILNEKGVSASDKAEKLARAGETLATPNNFIFANDVLDMALRVDPNNKRAQFYKHIVAIPMVAKGSLKRIKPLTDRNQKSAAEYARVVENIKAGSIKDFLLDGQEDIKSEEDFQAHLDEYTKAVSNLRNWLKENKSLELTLYVNPNGYKTGGAWAAAIRNCAWSKVVYSESVYWYEPSDSSYEECAHNSQEYKINTADVEAMQYIASGMQIYSTILNSYSLSGAIDTAITFEGLSPSSQNVLNALMKQPNFAKVRDPKAMRSIIDMGIDAVAGARWAQKMQDSLCPHGESNPENRPGYIFADGLCVKTNDPKIEKALDNAEAALAGQSFITTVGNSNEHVATKVKPVALLAEPISDLKTLRPQIDDCGQLTSISDDTAGGLFPNGNVQDLLKITNKQCVRFDGYFYKIDNRENIN